MLKNLKNLIHFKILATDRSDAFGKVKDIYFDEAKWAIRYLVVDTGKWLAESLVLVSPYNIIELDWDDEVVWVNLTKAQIESGPKVKINKPISRLYEAQYNSHYGLPDYWSSGMGVEIDGIWAGHYYPHLPEKLEYYNSRVESEADKDQHIHSINEVLGFHIQAVGDDNFGAVTDFIMEEAAWALRYIVIDSHHFWPGGKKILFSPAWIERIDWENKKFVTNFHRRLIESCPEYDPEVPVENLIEDSLLSHLGRSGNWNLKGWYLTGLDYTSHEPR